MPARQRLAVAGLVVALTAGAVVPVALLAAGSPAPETTPAADPRPAPDPVVAAVDPTSGSTGPEPPRPCRNYTAATGDATLGAARADGVDVAVIDPTGFEADDPRLADAVAATAAFRARGPLAVDDGPTRHGTETAAVVAAVAPEADLYLANFRRATDFAAAVDWAPTRDVDVVVAPATFHAKPDDGTAPVSRAIAEAADRGVPVVVPAGNAATGHWEGTYTGGPAVRFGQNRTRMGLRSVDGPVRAWL